MRRLPLRAEKLDDAWRRHASCRGLDTDLFFPPGTAGVGWPALEQVKRLCAGCPVQEPCLGWAITAGVSDGIWGGLTPLERRSRRPARPR